MKPWLLWELGVAQASKVPVLLLVANSVEGEPEKNIIPETQHNRFRESEFTPEFVEDHVGRFVELVNQHEIARFHGLSPVGNRLERRHV